FEALVRRAEAMLDDAPVTYRMRIRALALLGYAVLFGILALLIVLLGGTLWAAFASTALFILLVKKKIIILIAIMIWMLLKAIWVRFEPPQGRVLTRREAPQLFTELDTMRKQLALPRIHRVVLTDEFNAGMAQTPRLGVLGWQRNTLILGIRLLLALGPDQVRAVVAHEAGHLSGNHGRFNGWIYRVRTSWYRIMNAFDAAHGFSARILARFFDWFAPYFDAMTFALARANEYEADAVAAEVTAAPTVASALVSSAIVDELVSAAYWQPLFERASREPEPEPAPYHGLATFHREGHFDEGAVRERLDQALARKTGYDDTHPSLADRLAALGHSQTLLELPGESAAEHWLGAGLDAILTEFDQAWLADNAEAWRDHYKETREALDALEALEARDPSELESPDLWRRAALSEQHREGDIGLELFRRYAAREPADRDVDYVLAQILLKRDDPAGLEYIERAAEQFYHALGAYQQAYAFHARRGDVEQEEAWRLRIEAQIDREHAARVERDTLNKADTFVADELGAEWLEHLRGQLSAHKEVAAAWIARKQVTVAPAHPLYVIALKRRGWFGDNAKLAQRIADDTEAPGECFYVVRAGNTKKIADKVIKAGMQIF
ncbi:MAG: M48 family metallopeptidase, partial [Gammaproteobacteria bacterium]